MSRFVQPSLPRCQVRAGQFIGVRMQDRWIWSRVLAGGSVPAIPNPATVVVDTLDRNGAVVVPSHTVVRLPGLIVPTGDGWRGRDVLRDAKYCLLDGYKS